MTETIIYLDMNSKLNLRNHIRQSLVDSLLARVLPPEHKLPSSRKCSQQLEAARKAVALACRQRVSISNWNNTGDCYVLSAGTGINIAVVTLLLVTIAIIFPAIVRDRAARHDAAPAAGGND